ADNLRDVSDSHADLIALTNRWLGGALDPNVEDLFAAAPYSRRQVQRLVERFFGLSPKALARKYRAVRAAMLMSLPQLSDEMDAELAEAFYDQSHMIREIRLFAGRTPAKLGDDDSPFLTEMLDPKNLRELGG
ncbi:MAG: AraC family transcriptional regulator, partial [Pontixanthobacter sp.]